MLKHTIMWAFLCTTAPFVCSQNIMEPDTISNDSTVYPDFSRFLDEVVITAATSTNKTDGKTIRPSKEIKRTSTDGLDLLRKLQLSRIKINPITNSVDVSGGGEVKLCINGVESTSTQIASLQPQDIVRIEYHDNPGIRYADAAVVIDYITSRKESGGNVMFDSFDAIGKGKWASIDNLAAQYNRGRSVWSVNTVYFGKRSDDWVRDYDETWRYPDATITRHESGLPVTVSNHNLESSVSYNYLHPSGNMLNVRLGFNLEDVPNKEEGDRRAILEGTDIDEPIEIVEHTEEHTVQPNIGLYYLHKLTDKSSFIFDAQGSYIHSRMTHDYSENSINEISTVKGNKYAVRLLGMYENRVGSRVLNFGVSNNSSVLRNTYLSEEDVIVRINQTETALMGQYSDRIGNWGIMGNLKAVYRHLGQENKHLDKFFLLPEVTLSYKPTNKWFLRYSASLDHKMPLPAEISDVSQTIQSGMIRRGNPNLKPFRIIDQSFDINFEQTIVGVTGRVEYRNEHKPIMESIIYENGQFVRTFYNQRSFQRLMFGGDIAVRPWKDHLSIMVSPLLTRYFSHGVDYSHCHNIFRVGISVDFSYGSWLAYGNIMSGPANYMYGEEIIEEKDMNQIMVGYKRDKWSIHAGVFNAFIDYWMKSRNLSALTSYSSIAHSKHTTYFAVKFNLNLDFGRKGRDVNLPDHELDKDSGIIKGTK